MEKRFKIPQSVLVVIHTPQREVLLIRRVESDPAAPPFWQSVTGAKDSMDEEWALTAAREVWEETGLDCRPGGPLQHCLSDWALENVYPIYPRWLHRYAPGVTHNTERVFGLCVPAVCEVTLAPQEHTHYGWWPYAAAADLCFSPSNAEAILQLTHSLLSHRGELA
ncbi:MAG: dihydroneopterin triphosphate diphosphatase [Rhodoferax sp.]|nr:dihydroneopterin triphosphate diphosphatase [Rhodoferax sp.]